MCRGQIEFVRTPTPSLHAQPTNHFVKTKLKFSSSRLISNEHYEDLLDKHAIYFLFVIPLVSLSSSASVLFLQQTAPSDLAGGPGRSRLKVKVNLLTWQSGRMDRKVHLVYILGPCGIGKRVWLRY